MRVGLARLSFHQGGGAETTLGLLARGLLEAGHRVCVVCSQWQGPQPPGLEVEVLPLGPRRGWRRQMAFARAVPAAMARLGVESWLALERIPGCPVFRAGDGCHAAWLERRRAYAPWYKRLSFRLNPQHRAFLELERDTLGSPRLQRVIANSRLVAEELRRHYSLPRQRVALIYNAVDEKRLAPACSRSVRVSAREELGLRAGRPVLLFLGSGWERKGLAFALAALVHLPRAVLLVAGRDRLGPWRRLAARLGVGERVRFLGQRHDVPRLLAACDLLLSPTIYDPCANACLEALFVGRPVVTTTANGAAELIEPGTAGVVVEDPSRSRELAAACEQALDLRGPFGRRLPGYSQWVGEVAAALGLAQG